MAKRGGGGGSGGGSGSGSGGTSGTSSAATAGNMVKNNENCPEGSEDPACLGVEEEEDSPVREIDPRYKWLTLAIILAGVVIWILCLIYLELKEACRKKRDISGAFACALAYIHNYEERDPTKHVYRGLGKNKDVINEWIDDIWEAYELGEDEYLCHREMKLLIDQTF